MKKIIAALAGTLAGLAMLFTPSAQAAPKHDDCNRVAARDYSLCQEVKAQHAFGWTDVNGDPKNWMGAGKGQVYSITHQGYTDGEMRDALQSLRRYYRYYVTDVSFNLDAVVKKCGHANGVSEVRYVRQGNRLYTWRLVACD